VCNDRAVTVSQLDPGRAGPMSDVVFQPRFEILPFGDVEEQAAQTDTPLRLTVTTSPKHGIDRSLEVAIRLRALGHGVTLHVAARMVRAESHLDEILERCLAAGIDDLLVIGGDAPDPPGPFTDAGELLDVLQDRPLRPERIGIGGYPEGHPLISTQILEAALEHKARVADYIVTQLCFDAQILLTWVDRLRERGIDRPVYVGAVGPVERRRLLEISTKIGVGPSLRFLRNQHGLTALVRSPTDAAVTFYDDAAPQVGDPRRGIVGFHFFTFNDLLGTRRWEKRRRAALGRGDKIHGWSAP
jgi:methylenetetrahydrofolate reductase (NADPH)